MAQRCMAQGAKDWFRFWCLCSLFESHGTYVLC